MCSAACRAAQIDTIVTVARLRREGPARQSDRRRSQKAGHDRLSGRHPPDASRCSDKLRGCCERQQAAGRAQARRLGRDPVHLRIRRRAEGRRALPPQHAGECRASGRSHRFRPRRPGCSTCCRCSIRSGFTVGIVLPLVSGVPIYLYPSPLHYRTVPELIYGINATIMFGTDTFLAGYARIGAIPTISARCATSSPAPSRSRKPRAASIWKSSACAFWKATASPRPRRRWR